MLITIQDATPITFTDIVAFTGDIVDAPPADIGYIVAPFAGLTARFGKYFVADVKISLAHRPRSVYEASQAGYDLQLSGHTHGGMIPLGRWLGSLGQPFQSGLYKYKNIQLYVSNGTGYGETRLRYGTPSEISHLKLIRKTTGN